MKKWLTTSGTHVQRLVAVLLLAGLLVACQSVGALLDDHLCKQLELSSSKPVRPVASSDPTCPGPIKSPPIPTKPVSND